MQIENASSMRAKSGELPTVLLVDDEKDIADNLSALLEAYGYSTRTANSVREAHEVLREECIDIILSDIMMPKLRGTMLRPLIQSDPRFSHIPIIFMTGFDFESEQIAETVLSKPFSGEDLIAAINHADSARLNS